MRLLALLAFLPSLALAQGPSITTGPGTLLSGPRILGESTFAFELDALTQDEASRPGWPVTTTRASARWCETWSGWQSVAAGVPCIGKAGLAAFGPGMNSVPGSTDFGTGWTLTGDSRTQMSDSTGAFWRICGNGSGIFSNAITAATGEVWTSTFELRANTAATAQIGPNSATLGTHALSSEWKRYSQTGTMPTLTFTRAYLYVSGSGCVDVRQAQMEKSPTPGPRHDCGAAACSWAADVHTVSTAGWPVASGEVRLQYTPSWSGAPSSVRVLADSLSGSSGLQVYVWTDGLVYALAGNGTTTTTAWSLPLTWVAGTTYEVIVTWGGGWISVRCSDVAARTAAFTGSIAFQPTMVLGGNRTGSGFANGHIRLIRVSQ